MICKSCSLWQRLRCFLTGCDEYNEDCDRIQNELDLAEKIRRVKREIDAAMGKREGR